MSGYDYNTLLNSVGVGCESPAPAADLLAQSCQLKDGPYCKSLGNESSFVSEQSYKDSLAAKNDTAREEINADFAQRNADLKDYVQPDATKPQFTINPAKLEKYRKEFLRIRAGHESDGFYARVPQIGRAEGLVLSERDRLLQIIRQLTDLLAKR